MDVTAIGRAAHATRRAATAATGSKPTSLTLVGGVAALCLGWALVVTTSFEIIGRPLPPAPLMVLLSALISGTVTLAVWSRFGNGLLYSIFCAGRAAERESQRRDARQSTGTARVGVR